MVKNCKNCGLELDDNAVFCDECGTKVGESSPKNINRVNINNPFNRYNIDMIPGEKVIRSSQIHVGCLYLPLIVMGLGFFSGFIILLEIISSGYFYPGAIVLPFNGVFIIGLVWLIIRFISYKNNDLILTNKRVFGKCGLISTTQMQSPLNRIDTVSYSNGFFGKLIGYGTIEIATSSSHFKFRFVREGQSFANDIFNQLEISQKEKIFENAKAIADAISK